MLFDRRRPHAFREKRVAPSDARVTAQAATNAVKERADRNTSLEAFAVHAARDDTRVVTVEAWRDTPSYLADRDADETGAALFAWAATGGTEPTPVDDSGAGVIVIDLFRVWRPLLGPISAFNIRNGAAFNKEPGCISTTVLRGVTVGAIATYARWRSPQDFAAAFAKITGKPAKTLDDVNAAAARMTFGLIRPDYHAYELIAFKGGLS